jgi:hypothetical protein
MRRGIGIVALLMALPVHAGTTSHLVTASPKECAQGLYQQPNGGPFSVFLFCDDAGGVNIGVVNTSGGAGPGLIDLGPRKEWGKWSVNDRFWQEPAWATDITSFAWSPNLRALYIGTAEIYGTGKLYKLDLINRTAQAIAPKSEWRLNPKLGHSTTITGIDLTTGEVSVEFSIFDESSKGTEVRKLKVK